MASTISGRPGSSAVDSFAMGFAKDMALEGIRVNAVRPGMVLTEIPEDRLKDPTFRTGIGSPMISLSQAAARRERSTGVAIDNLVHDPFRTRATQALSCDRTSPKSFHVPLVKWASLIA